MRNKSLFRDPICGILLRQLSEANPRVQEKCYSVPLCLHLHSTSSSMWMMCFLSSHKDAIYTGLGFTLIQYNFSSVQFIRSVMSDSLWSHGLQHTRLSCPSPTPRACLNSNPLSWWCHPTISPSFVPFSSHLQSFPSVFSSEWVLCIRWPKYWSFSFSTSPSNKYSGLIFFRIDWFDLLVFSTSPSNEYSGLIFFRIDWFDLLIVQDLSTPALKLNSNQW